MFPALVHFTMAFTTAIYMGCEYKPFSSPFPLLQDLHLLLFHQNHYMLHTWSAPPPSFQNGCTKMECARLSGLVNHDRDASSRSVSEEELCRPLRWE
jgi:hypothetical protein